MYSNGNRVVALGGYLRFRNGASLSTLSISPNRRDDSATQERAKRKMKKMKLKYQSRYSPQSGRLGRDSERGSSLVEFTIVAGLLLSILFGIIEFGLVFRNQLTIANASQTAGRVGAAQGDRSTADMAMLDAVASAVQSLPNQGVGTLRWVDIYKVDSNGNAVGDCSTGTDCTRYAYTPSASSSRGAGNGICANWSPCGVSAVNWTSRDSVLPGVDVLGIKMHFAHNWVTSVLPLADVTCRAADTNCWTSEAIFRLEPSDYGV